MELKKFTFEIRKCPVDSECIQLLSQVMDTYNYLTLEERDSVAVWFGTRYRRKDFDHIPPETN